LPPFSSKVLKVLIKSIATTEAASDRRLAISITAIHAAYRNAFKSDPAKFHAEASGITPGLDAPPN
tara:strand:- start:9414 stop:9611 length:198 start_codon:yes stop_codon:yes gene_type:complete